MGKKLIVFILILLFITGFIIYSTFIRLPNSYSSVALNSYSSNLEADTTLTYDENISMIDEEISINLESLEEEVHELEEEKYELENQIMRLEDENNYIKSTIIELLEAEELRAISYEELKDELYFLAN
ncbi:exported protein of unknown function [Acetoanaerobium sticklandii]|uniref:Uncharacterized protein n=1 Tax=Acetoanaerobium sticklandii (strain ATCC 12662 / DSM 519 / JCM 1433 / CCUG 9281 / NCIMB 10654 / HF) TaxID=499177 RepID=E3PSE0_ACESD|nr:hypothetical protein [Acetoanaerobium sticklandii]CBH21794.1 exported protein of unknown function [Acetoanaerobium sticklandii]